MSCTFFSKEISQNYSYLLLNVCHNNKNYCGTYYKGLDGEYITSILTGEKFYSLEKFISSVKEGKDDWHYCNYYDEEIDCWFPLEYL